MEYIDSPEKILVSIVVPFSIRNDLFIKELIDRLCHINNDEIECIFIDDGCESSITSLVQEEVKIVKNSRYFINESNRGVSYSRNKGIKEARGRYVLFIDSDDLINTQILENVIRLLDQIDSNELLCLKFDYFTVDIAINLDNCDVSLGSKITSSKALHDYLYFDNSLSPYLFKSACGKLFDREILLNNNIFFSEELTHYEDALFVSKYFLCIDDIRLVNSDIFYFYRENISSKSRSFDKNLVDQLRIYYHLFEQYCSKYSDVLVFDTLYLFVPYMVSNLSLLNKNKISKKHIKEVLKLDFVKQSIIQLELLNIENTTNKYLSKIKYLTKKVPNCILVLYIYYYCNKYL